MLTLDAAWSPLASAGPKLADSVKRGSDKKLKACPRNHLRLEAERQGGKGPDKFVVTFMDAPMKPANDAMQAWALGLRDIKG